MLYHRWSHLVKTNEFAVIQPDGCRDLIVISMPGKQDELRLTNWDTRPRNVELRAGTELTGYRLRPGLNFCPSIVETENPSKEQLEALIESEASADRDIIEIIEALTQPLATIESVSKQQGVTTRTLQRRFQSSSLPTPDYWRLLGRARRATHALPCRVSLAEIAYEYGYSDQAHMTRELVRWFGLTPSQLRQSKVPISEICQPGLGNWGSDGTLELGNLH